MAAPTPAPRQPLSSKGVIPAEWPAQAADTIVDTIAIVRDKTTKPILVAARAAIYGLVTAVVGTICFWLILVLIVRLYDVYAPGPVWPIYAFFAVVFTAGGLYALRQANKPVPTSEL